MKTNVSLVKNTYKMKKKIASVIKKKYLRNEKSASITKKSSKMKDLPPKCKCSGAGAPQTLQLRTRGAGALFFLI